jgi:hypothetical protein
MSRPLDYLRIAAFSQYSLSVCAESLAVTSTRASVQVPEVANGCMGVSGRIKLDG